MYRPYRILIFRPIRQRRLTATCLIDIQRKLTQKFGRSQPIISINIKGLCICSHHIHFLIYHDVHSTILCNMTWSPTYKKNRISALNGMKIIDRGNYDRMREYYAVLNGQINLSDSPRNYTEMGSMSQMLNGFIHSAMPSLNLSRVAEPVSSETSSSPLRRSFVSRQHNMVGVRARTDSVDSDGSDKQTVGEDTNAANDGLVVVFIE